MRGRAQKDNQRRTSGGPTGKKERRAPARRFGPCGAETIPGPRDPPHRGAKTAQRGRQGAQGATRADPLPLGASKRADRRDESAHGAKGRERNTPPTAEDCAPWARSRNQAGQTNGKRQRRPPPRIRGRRGEHRRFYTRRQANHLTRLRGGPRKGNEAGSGMGAGCIVPAPMKQPANARMRGWDVPTPRKARPVPPAARFRGGTNKGSWGAVAGTGRVWEARRPPPPMHAARPSGRTGALAAGKSFCKIRLFRNARRSLVTYSARLRLWGLHHNLFGKAGFCERKVGRRPVPPRRRA